MRTLAPMLLVSCLIGCTQLRPWLRANDTQPQVSESTQTATIDGFQRLDRSVLPEHYRLILNFDPRTNRLRGSVDIQIRLQAPKSKIVLHAAGPKIGKVSAWVNNRELKARLLPGINGGIGIEFAEPIPVGRAVLKLNFESPVDEGNTGIFRLREAGAWYAFSHFEPMGARQSFPCFDQPDLKAPFAITIKTPKGMQAVSNGPEVGRKDEGDYTTFDFGQTRAMPTYLVAMAVGALETITAPRDSIICSDALTPIILNPNPQKA